MYAGAEITAPPRQSSNLERMLLGSSFLHTQYTFDTEILLLRLNSSKSYDVTAPSLGYMTPKCFPSNTHHTDC